MVEQGRKGCEFGAASVLDPLAKLPGRRNPLAFLVWDGDGRGGQGRRGEKQGHRAVFFSPRNPALVFLCHMCAVRFSFSSSFFSLALGLVCCRFAECLFWLLGEVLTKEVEEQTHFSKQPAPEEQ